MHVGTIKFASFQHNHDNDTVIWKKRGLGTHIGCIEFNYMTFNPPVGLATTMASTTIEMKTKTILAREYGDVYDLTL